MHVIFEPNAKFPSDVNSWFVTEGHVRLNFCGVSADQVWPFVAIHAHSVSDPVGKKFVVGTVARSYDHISRGSIDGPAFRAGFGGSLMLGRLSHPAEFEAELPLVALTILFGVYPKPVLDMSAASIQQLVNNYNTAVTAVKAAALLQ